MVEYIYKGFKVAYDTKFTEHPKCYCATGSVSRANQKGILSILQKFHTENKTKRGAQKEIERLLKEYIDFEWQKYNQMQESE